MNRRVTQLRTALGLGRCCVGFLLLSLPTARAQVSPPAPSGEARAGIAGARAIARYKQSLAANPAEGTALDRLWTLAEESGTTSALLEEFAAQADAGLAGALVYGHLLKKAGRLDDAATAYRRAAVLAPTDPRPALALAALEKGRGRHDATAAALQAALATLPGDDPRRVETLLALGAAFLAAGDGNRAAETWEQTVLAAPRNLSVRRELADAYEKNGLPERALPHHEYIEKNAPDPATRAAAARVLGRLHEARGNFDAARAALERARALTAPGNWLRSELQTELVRLHERAGRLPELEGIWRAQAEKSPRDLGGWLALAELYAATGNADRERGVLERIVALGPRDRDAALRLARLTAEAGDLERAGTLFDGLLKAQPGNFDLVLERAGLDLRQGRLTEAASRVEAAARSRPGDESIASAALAFFQSNRLHAATERALRAEMIRRAAAPEPVLALANFLFDAKRVPEALALLDEFVITPAGADPVAAEARATRGLRAAELCRTENRLDDAVRFARAAVAAQPSAAAGRLALADLLLLAGDAEGARSDFATVADDPAAPADQRLVAEQKLFAACRALPAGDKAGTAATPGGSALPRRPPPPAKTGSALLGPSVVMRADRRLLVGSTVYPNPRGAFGRTAVVEDESAAVVERAAELEAAAEARPTAENYLRLARWQSWRRAQSEALAAAKAAVKAAPESVAAHEALVRFATESRDRPAASAALTRLAALDAENAARYRRQIGHLRLEAGDTDGAVELFAELCREDPASRENLTDLALAQQRAGNWTEAVAAWERAYRLPARGSSIARAELRGSLVGALERTNEFQRALEVLDAAVEEQTDRAARRSAFRDLLAFATKHARLESVERTHAARLQARPQDPVLLGEMAALHRARGRTREAFALLERALPGAADTVGALRELVTAAEEFGDFKSAIQHQRRLVQLDPAAGKDSSGLEKLAALELGDLDLDAATRTWTALVQRFPRDPDALARAQEFFETVADDPATARGLLRQIVAIEPNDLARWLRLGRLELAEGGDRAAARRAFEEIIARTEPDPTRRDRGAVPPTAAGETPFLPSFAKPASARQPQVRGASEESVAGAPRKETSSDEGQLRLLAIGEVSALLRAEPASAAPTLRAWLERWRATAEEAPVEAFWAFYYAGETGLALDLFERSLLPRQPDDARLQSVFLDCVFTSGDHARLARWLRPGGDAAGDSEVRMRRLSLACLALARYVPFVDTDTLDPGLLDALFPEAGGSGEPAPAMPREKLWQAATQVLAPAGRFADAVRLGERVFASSVTGRAACGLQLARWHVLLRQPERARAILGAAFQSPGSPATLTASDNEDAAWEDECLRAYYQLLPAAERAPFREQFARVTRAASARGQHDRSQSQRLVSLLLLDGLAGDWARGQRHLDALLKLQPLSDRAIAGSEDPAAARRWRFWLELGERLQNWSFDPLAAHLWKRTLAEPALVGLGVDPVLRQSALREVRVRLAVLQLSAAQGDAGRAELVLRDLLGGEIPAETLTTLRTRLGAGPGSVPAKAERLASLATLSVATRLAELLCAREPQMAENWRALLNVYTTAGAIGPLERTLRHLLFDRHPAPSPRVAVVRDPMVPRVRDSLLPRRELALRLTDLLENAGDLPAAARLLESVLRSPQTPAEIAPGPVRETVLLLRLAANFEKQGNLPAAARWCREVLRLQPADAQAALILARTEDALGDPESATRTLERAFAAMDTRAAPTPLLVVGGSPPPSVPRAFAELVVTIAKRHLAGGNRARATALARDLLRTGQIGVVQEIATALAQEPAGDRGEARALFEGALRASRDAQGRVAAQRLLLERAAPSPRNEPAAFARHLRRLRRLAEESRTPEPPWQTIRFDAYVQDGLIAELEKILRAEWADGRGDPASGAKLALLLLRAGTPRAAELAVLVRSFSDRPTLDEDATAEVAGALEKAGHSALSLPLASRLARRFPQNVTYALQQARQLWRSGQSAEADASLADLEAGAVFNPGHPLLIASLWREDLNEPERARGVLARAVLADPGASRAGAPVRRALARAEIARENFGAAHRLLREANAASAGSYATDELGFSLDYLDARGQLEAAGDPGVALGLGLPVGIGNRLVAAAFQRLMESGRGDAALRLVAARPAQLAELPAVAARLREQAEKPETPDAKRLALIDLFERALAADNPQGAAGRLAHELALLLDATAARETAPSADTAPNQQDPALERLKRACQLEPGGSAARAPGRRTSRRQRAKRRGRRARPRASRHAGCRALRPGNRATAARRLGGRRGPRPLSSGAIGNRGANADSTPAARFCRVNR